MLTNHKAAYQTARNRIFISISQSLGRNPNPAATPETLAQRVQQNSFVFTLLHFYQFITTNRLFPLLYIIVFVLSITPSSIKSCLDIPADRKCIWVLLCTATTIIYDRLEMGVLATTLLAEATTARAVILYFLLPPMIVATHPYTSPSLPETVA